MAHPLGAMQNVASRMASWYRCHSGGFRRQPAMLRGASSSAMSCGPCRMRVWVFWAGRPRVRRWSPASDFDDTDIKLTV